MGAKTWSKPSVYIRFIPWFPLPFSYDWPGNQRPSQLKKQLSVFTRTLCSTQQKQCSRRHRNLHRGGRRHLKKNYIIDIISDTMWKLEYHNELSALIDSQAPSGRFASIEFQSEKRTSNCFKTTFKHTHTHTWLFTLCKVWLRIKIIYLTFIVHNLELRTKFTAFISFTSFVTNNWHIPN